MTIFSNVKLTNSLVIIVVAEVFLGFYSIFGSDLSLKAAAIGAMIGLAGGHLNGANPSVSNGPEENSKNA